MLRGADRLDPQHVLANPHHVAMRARFGVIRGCGTAAGGYHGVGTPPPNQWDTGTVGRDPRTKCLVGGPAPPVHCAPSTMATKEMRRALKRATGARGPHPAKGRALELARQGRSNKEIAVVLGVAESTVSRWTKEQAHPDRELALAALHRAPLLTSVEREVLSRAAAGESNRAIAKSRGTSPHTVANQLRTAYTKAGVNSRRELRALVDSGSRKN